MFFSTEKRIKKECVFSLAETMKNVDLKLFEH